MPLVDGRPPSTRHGIPRLGEQWKPAICDSVRLAPVVDVSSGGLTVAGLGGLFQVGTGWAAVESEAVIGWSAMERSIIRRGFAELFDDSACLVVSGA